MALNINGTTGISGVDGSVSAPAVTGTDSNTGITFPAADTIKFSTGGVERMSITNSGVSGITTGKVLQVVSVQLTNQITYNGTSFDNISGFNASITPASTSNKVLVMFNINAGSNNNGNRIVFRISRTGDDNEFVGDASGSRVRATAQMGVSNASDQRSNHISYLSSPSSTSAVTYQLQAKLQVGGGSSVRFGASGSDSDSSLEGRTPQSIILMEIAA